MSCGNKIVSKLFQKTDVVLYYGTAIGNIFNKVPTAVALFTLFIKQIDNFKFQNFNASHFQHLSFLCCETFLEILIHKTMTFCHCFFLSLTSLKEERFSVRGAGIESP